MTAAAPPATSYDVVTAVWGREFIDLFLDLCIPNQLSPGNLPTLPSGSRYRIFTTHEDVPALQSSPRLDALRRVVPVDVVDVDMTEADRSAKPGERGNVHKRMIACHRRAVSEAAPGERALIFLTPDVILAEGTLSALVRRHSGGARAVVIAALRLARDPFLEEWRTAHQQTPLAPRELVRLGMRHLHPSAQWLMADSARTSDNPTAIYWPVRSGDQLDGILVRSFYLHPVLVDPVRRTALPGGPIDSHYIKDCCPDLSKVHVIDDSDELVVFELSPVGRSIGRHIARHGVSPLRLTAATTRCDRHHIVYWQHGIRLHAGDLDARWTDVEAAASRFAHRFARYRSWGPVLVGVFEWLKWLRRRHDAYHTALRKARRRYPRLVLGIRQRVATVDRRVRRSIRPPVTVKQVVRPAKLMLHRGAKLSSLALKRIRRRVLLFGR